MIFDNKSVLSETPWVDHSDHGLEKIIHFLLNSGGDRNFKMC